jgi:hypothetical protein
VKILDSNDKPYDIKPSTLSVEENTQGETSVEFTVLDQDTSQSHGCLVQDSEFFVMNNTHGQSVLWVKSGAVLDHERNSTISSKFIHELAT